MKDHYATLDLASKRFSALTPRDLKSAYRAALLASHPDKSASSLSGPAGPPPDSESASTSTSASALNTPGNVSPAASAASPIPDHPAPRPSDPQPKPSSPSMPKTKPSRTPNPITIDAITEAYTTLASPTKKAIYDTDLANFLALSRSTTSTTANASSSNSSIQADSFRSIETVDLDDLTPETEADGSMRWVRSCRCGIYSGREFLVTEDELAGSQEGETAQRASAGQAGQAGHAGQAGYGEVLVSCRGCSLWLRVGFAVVDDDE